MCVSLSKTSTATGDIFRPISAVLRRGTVAMLPAGLSPNDTEVRSYIQPFDVLSYKEVGSRCMLLEFIFNVHFDNHKHNT